MKYSDDYVLKYRLIDALKQVAELKRRRKMSVIVKEPNELQAAFSSDSEKFLQAFLSEIDIFNKFCNDIEQQVEEEHKNAEDPRSIGKLVSPDATRRDL